jgi:hypothetical protein
VTYAALPIDVDWEPKKTVFADPSNDIFGNYVGNGTPQCSGKQLARRDEAPVSFRCATATGRAASGHVSIYNRAHPKKMGECAALHVA